MSKFTTAVRKRSTPSKQPWNPLGYMRKAVKFLLEHACAALFLDPGLGKTSITLAAFKFLRKRKVARGMLVVAPLRAAVSTWPKELAKWADFEGLDMVLLHGPHKERLVREQHDIYVINYEGLAWLFTREKVGKVRVPRLTAAGKALLEHVDTLVWDELSKMKHTNTLRYELVKPWLKKFARRWGLTGSPAANGLLDLFGQCYVLDEGRTLGPYITHYRAHFFRPVDKNGYVFVLQEGAEEAIYERLRPLALRMDADDYLELPEEVPHVLKLDFPPEARELYEEMEEELLIILDSEIVTAANEAVAKGKCRQICAGAVFLSDLDPITGEARRRRGPREWRLVHDTKLDALEDLVDELQGQQLLVLYEFNHDLERLQKRFPGVPHIGGGVSAKQGSLLEEAWNRGELRMLFGHPESVSLGLNLQQSHAQHVVWWTLTWNYEHYDQANRRLRRQGNKAKHVHVHHFVMRDSVEESVLYALRRKERTQQQLFAALKARRRVAE